MKALYIASTGMAAQEQNVEIISNNIANMRTTGYKKQRAEFQDLLYQVFQRAGSATSDQGTQVPSGIEIGSGVMTSATPRVMTQGTVTPTEKDLDLAVQGTGYFAVQLPDGRTGYTRDGSFERNSSGLLVNSDGYQVEPGITIPDNANNLSISADGIVQAYVGTDTAPTQLGQLQLYRFVNEQGLESIGNNNYVATAASGEAQAGTPNTDGMGNVMQGYLEEANVNPVTEVADLIAAQRAYEMNARVITGADEMLQTVSQMH
ncbi:MAG TPA: flagellar basal-body rod protein FlgG [Devosia sp.]|jgi:flagellar basal-body rod protein FlgG|nr:flagellar basal-body rod protein FlgG [Devosia sp.]